MDQELSRMQRANDVIGARRASGQPADGAVHAVASGGWTSWLPYKSVKSNSNFDERFTWRTILPNFIPIRFETTEPQSGFLRSADSNKKNKKNNNKVSSDMRSVPDPKIRNKK